MSTFFPATGSLSSANAPGRINRMIACFAIGKLLLHFAANSNYGLHADELYYIALSDHPQWGYLDNGPLITWMVKLSSAIFGTGLFAWRLLPSTCAALMVVFTGKMTQRLGGGKMAVTLACTAMLCSPAFTATSYLLQPVIFDQFFWTAITYSLLSYRQSGKDSYLFTASVLTGLGILNKYSILLFLLFFVLPFLWKSRLAQRSRTLILPVLLILIIVLPNILWQYQHGFPGITYLQLVTHRQVYQGPGDFIFQLLFFHGAAMAVWLAGIAYLLTARDQMKVYRPAGYGFLILLPALYLLNGKLYYLLGAFPFLFAAGGLCWEKMLTARPAVLKAALLSGMAAVGLIALPVVLPILPFGLMKRYLSLMHTYTPIDQPLRWDDGRVHALPQYFADMLAWQDLAKKVAEAKMAAVYTENYAAAAAIQYYSDGPPVQVFAKGNSFAEWSPPALPEELILITSENPQQVRSLAENVSLIADMDNHFATSGTLKVYLIKSPARSFSARYRGLGRTSLMF
ncbi:MAG: glycosyltransferase family 39 protein [Mucilaginibacter sp.]|nr:glycosyltransferase family 39 protein [Mucilaginibacter sp.]